MSTSPKTRKSKMTAAPTTPTKSSARNQKPRSVEPRPRKQTTESSSSKPSKKKQPKSLENNNEPIGTAGTKKELPPLPARKKKNKAESSSSKCHKESKAPEIIDPGKLTDAIKLAVEKDNKVVAALVIDETIDDGTHKIIKNQVKVLECVTKLGGKVCCVNIDPTLKCNVEKSFENMREAGLAKYANSFVFKESILLFHPNTVPNPVELLKGVDILVLMGCQTNCCIMQAAVGGRGDNRNGKFQKGATQLGFTVWSSNAICHGGRASWTGEEGVKFFKKV